jgi:hypothetical protein
MRFAAIDKAPPICIIAAAQAGCVACSQTTKSVPYVGRAVCSGLRRGKRAVLENRTRASWAEGRCMRSFVPFRAVRGGSMADRFVVANDVVVTMARAQSVASSDDVDASVAMPVLSSRFVGLAGVSIPGGGQPRINYQDSTVQARHRRIIESAHAAGVKVGVLAPTQEDLETVIDFGIETVSCASDTALVLGGAAASPAPTRAMTENNVAGRSALAQA